MFTSLRAAAALCIVIILSICLIGCTTSPIKIKITPLKVEINQTEPATKAAQ